MDAFNGSGPGVLGPPRLPHFRASPVHRLTATTPSSLSSQALRGFSPAIDKDGTMHHAAGATSSTCVGPIDS
jgi:hypothetical protein